MNIENKTTVKCWMKKDKEKEKGAWRNLFGGTNRLIMIFWKFTLKLIALIGKVVCSSTVMLQIVHCYICTAMVRHFKCTDSAKEIWKFHSIEGITTYEISMYCKVEQNHSRRMTHLSELFIQFQSTNAINCSII